MTPDRYHQVMQIVDRIIDRPDEREQILGEVCNGDDSLRREVEQLLTQQPSITEFLEHSPLEALSELTVDPLIGSRIGPYCIIEAIGRGGMGAVYKGRRDDDEYKTVVAVKLIKRGMDTDYVLRRFRNERQIVANLNHPNIARLLDGGSTRDGLPYFVMEYVDGEPIDDYCANNRLPIGERLKLFRAACAAVQYAHQSLVIHRDLKPSNILVTREGTPKLLDFGIAKLVQAEADGPVGDLTATELRVMTPHYASPEQIKGEPITTASDVYSLGVVLYELLTGRRPYRFKSKRPDEVARVVCGEEPDRPSKATGEQESAGSESESPASADGHGKHSPTYAGGSALRGDLDAIVLMALRKEPERRYASVEQFSEDIRRHLAKLPVRAHKDATAYRAAKFVKRHQVGATVAVLLLITLLAGMVATIWQVRVARAERAKAERRFNDVRRLANSFMFEFYDEIDKSPTKAKELMVKRAIEYLDSLSQEAGGDIGLQRDLATAYYRIGNLQGAVFLANLGDTQGALESHRKALALREKLIRVEPNNPELRRELAESYREVGIVLSTSFSKPEEAVEHYRQALAILEPLSAAVPSDLKILKFLSATYNAMALALGGGAHQTANMGDANPALEYYRKSISAGETLLARNPSDLDNRQRLGATHSNVGHWMNANGRPAEALEYYQQALAIDENLMAEQRKNVLIRREVAVQHSNIASQYLQMGDNTRSLEHALKALTIYEASAAEDKNNVGARRDLAIGYRNVGKALASTNETARAAKHFRRAVEIFADLLKQDAINANIRRQLAFTHLQMSILLTNTGNLNGAINQAKVAITDGETLVAANAKNTSAQRTLADSYAQLGKCHRLLATKPATPANNQRAHWQEARNEYQTSLNIWEKMRDNGVLSVADANKPDELTKEIAKCDAALARR